MGIDADGDAYRKLASSLPAECRPSREGGAAFLVDRDGTIRCAWSGIGHAADMLAAARERP
jgi:hypothetical protein